MDAIEKPTRVSLDMPRALHREVKKRAIDEGVTLREWLLRCAAACLEANADTRTPSGSHVPARDTSVVNETGEKSED